MNILIVEDEILVQKSLKILLEKKGATVTTTGSGHEAIGLILNHQFDKIVCDIMLLDITGFDVIEEVRKKYTPQGIMEYFVIMTAYCSDSILKKVASYNCPLLRKPFGSIDEALEIIMRNKNEKN